MAEFYNEINEFIAWRLTGRISDDQLLLHFQSICKKIIKRKNDDEEFSLWGRFINGHLDLCLVSRIDLGYQAMLRMAYDLAMADLVNRPQMEGGAA